MLKYFFVCFLLKLVNSFSYNSVPKQSILFFPIQITNNEQVPFELYNSFYSKLSNNNLDIYKSISKTEDTKTIKKISETNNTITLVSHSSGMSNLVKVFEENKNIVDNVVLIDPIYWSLKDNRNKVSFNLEDFEDNLNDLMEENIFTILKNSFFNKKIQKIYSSKYPNFENVNKLTYILDKKSSRWKLFPPIPPIKKFVYKYDLIKNKNSKYIELEDYGHFDLLDSQWSNYIHKSISRGTSDRENLDEYHQKISDLISGTYDEI